jgi:hypothetical protein
VVLNGTRNKKSADTEGRIVPGHGLEIGVHYGVTGFARREMGEAEGVEINGCVWDVALREKIGRFAENG